MIFLKESILNNAYNLLCEYSEESQIKFGTDDYQARINNVLDELLAIKSTLRRGSDRKTYRKEVASLQRAIEALRYIRRKSGKVLEQNIQTLTETELRALIMREAGVTRSIKSQTKDYKKCDGISFNFLPGFDDADENFLGKMLGTLGVPDSACNAWDQTFGRGAKTAGNRVSAMRAHSNVNTQIEKASNDIFASRSSAIMSSHLDGFGAAGIITPKLTAMFPDYVSVVIQDPPNDPTAALHGFTTGFFVASYGGNQIIAQLNKIVSNASSLNDLISHDSRGGGVSTVKSALNQIYSIPTDQLDFIDSHQKYVVKPFSSKYVSQDLNYTDRTEYKNDLRVASYGILVGHIYGTLRKDLKDCKQDVENLFKSNQREYGYEDKANIDKVLSYFDKVISQLK